MLWVVACRFDPERPVIFDCLEHLREHHPVDPILVVDSDSPDLSYVGELSERFNCVVAAIGNRDYCTGAYRYAIEQFPQFDHYALIHDSLLVNANLDHVTDSPLTTVRYFLQPPNTWPRNDDGVELHQWAVHQAAEHMDVVLPGEFAGVFGPMFFANREVCRRLLASGFFDIRPADRFEAQCMERLAGIALTQLGYDVTQAPALQGEMHGFFDEYDSTYVDKVHLTRA